MTASDFRWRPMTPIAREAERSFGLPAWAYTEPEVLAAEREHIFRHGWVFIAHRSQLREAGSYVAGFVADLPVFVVNDGGVLRGFHNVCLHRAHELLAGEGRITGALVCPYHAWSYSTDGRLRRAPNSARVCDFEPHKMRLRALRVEELHGLVFVNVDADARALAVQAPGLAAAIAACFPGLPDYERIGVIEHDMRMNWKVRIDNSLECNHCKPVHRSFCEIVDMDRYRTTTASIYSTQTGSMRESAGAGAAEHEVVYWYLWPLTELNAGTLWPMFSVFVNRPLAVDRTLMTLSLYAPASIGEAAHTAILDAWRDNDTNAEDLRLGESVQRGLGSPGFSQGRFMVDREAHFSEHAVHHFHRLVAAALDLPREPE